MVKARILVVEDESVIAMDIERNLQDLGYEVTARVGTGEQAISRVEGGNIDLVLMDIMLGTEMDGIEAAEQIRSRFKVPVIFLTAFANDEILARAKIAGPHGYIVKPFDQTDLKIAVEIGLHTAKVEAEREQLIAELQEALSKVKALSGLLPICASCKKIRNDKGYWQAVEGYISEHSEAEFTHGICPDCVKKLYPDIYEKHREDFEGLKKPEGE